jgi:hypothetical protein
MERQLRSTEYHRSGKQLQWYPTNHVATIKDFVEHNAVCIDPRLSVASAVDFFVFVCILQL